MTTTGWGYYIQGQEHQQRIEQLGSKLSIQLGCPIHYPAWGKRLFECKCGVLFPVYIVEAAASSGDWTMVEKKHKEADNGLVSGYTGLP